MQKERISNETLSILATVHYLRKQLYAILNSQSHVKLLFSESSSYLLGSPVRRSFFVQKRGNQHTIKHDGSQLRIMHRKNDFIEHKLSDPETNCSKVQHCIPLHYTQQQQYTVHNTSRILMLLSFGSYVVLVVQHPMEKHVLHSQYLAFANTGSVVFQSLLYDVVQGLEK